MKNTTAKKTHYRRITDSIIASIEAGAGDFKMPWHKKSGRPVNGVTGYSYRGINVLSLWCAGELEDKSNQWATFKQWQQKGGCVRKGSKGTPVVFYLPAKPNEESESKSDDENKRSRMVLKFSNVFNRDDVDDLPPIDDDGLIFEKPETLEHVETFVTNTGATVVIGGDSAYYSPSTDMVQMPDPSLFFEGTPTEAWYSVLLHELSHWSGRDDRLGRFDCSDIAKFGTEAYAQEELVAELSASLLACDLGIEIEPRPDHAQYIATWLHKLREDETAFPMACVQAEKAVNYLHSLQVVDSKNNLKSTAF